MPAPLVTASELLSLPRSRPGSPSSRLSVSLCTLAPPGAPEHVRPRFVSIAIRGAGDRLLRRVAIRRSELAQVLAALTDAARELALDPADPLDDA